MAPLSFGPIRAAALLGVLALVAGCQHYEPRPLDLDGHSDAWRGRAPGDDSVRAFAEQLAGKGHSSGLDLSDGLSLAEAEVVALVYNPDLRMARLRVGVAAATVEHAEVWADPEFSMDFLRVTEAVADPWVITPGLALTIPVSGRLEAEKARAGAALRMSLIEVAEEEWETRLALRRAWARWSAAVFRGEQIESLLATIEPLALSTGRLAQAGELPSAEAGLFAIEQATQRQALTHARGEAAEWLHRIRMLIGLSPDAPLHCRPSLQSQAGHDLQIEDSLGLARLREAYEMAEQTLLREVRRQYPDLVIGPLYESDQGQSRVGFFGAVPLPVFNANRQAIAEARAEREVARAAFEIEYERVAGSLAVMRTRLDSASAARQALEVDVVPLVDRQLDAARRVFELGEGGVLVLLESLVQAGRVRLALIDARLNEMLATTEVASLSVPAGVTGPQPANPTGGPVSEPVINALEVVP